MNNQFYTKLGYNEFLIDNSEIKSVYPNFNEIEQLGADKVYFSGKNPTVLFVEVKSFNTVYLKKIAEIQHKAWNYRKILLLFALSDTEIRIYNCQEKPEYIGEEDDDPNKKLSKAQIFSYEKSSDEQALKILSEVFSRIGVDCGLLWTTDYEVKSRVNIQRRLDKFLVDSLKRTAIELKSDIPQQEIIHALLMRSLFILFLEDKGAAKEAGLYEKILPGASSYFEILDDIMATYQLFNEVQIHFNGNVFPIIEGEAELVKLEHLRLIKKCFTDGDLSNRPNLFDGWRLFNFKIIQIELLSEIYENFLGELKHEKGQFYTPFSLVELILNDKLPIDQTDFKTKVLDPACGSGIFLVESYKRLIKRWKKANPNGKISFDTLTELLLSNIYGIEIDPTAIKVAAFSLYLALVDELDPKTLWIEPNYQLPYLIYDPDDTTIKKQGKNLWRRDTIGQVNADEFVKVDLVVGNPPFGTKKIQASIKNYLEERKYPQQMVLAFIDKAVFFSPKGTIALIFNTKSLTNTNKKYNNFRKWLFAKNHTEKVYNLSIFRRVEKNFGDQLFDGATVPISIVYFQKEKPAIVPETVEYCAPKTYVRNNLVDGIIIDSTDIKFLPRAECQKPDTKIWKIAMWGGMQDFQLLYRLSSRFPSLKRYFSTSKNIWNTGTGYIADSEKLEVIPPRIIRTQGITRYYTKESTCYLNERKYRKITKDLFTPPYVVVKEGQHNNEIAASYIDYSASTLKSTYLINGLVNNEIKQTLVTYINSVFANYFLFLSSSSWGIERERILFEELLELPAIIKDIGNEPLQEIGGCFEQLKSVSTNHELKILENKLNAVLYEVIGLNAKEQILIEDCLKFQLDLFDHGHNSIALHRTLQPENLAYANMLCSELNTFLNPSKTRVSACIYDVGLRDPLNMVVLHFGKQEKPVEEKSIEALRKSLKNIDGYMLQKKSDSIYVQKQVKYFDYENDLFYLIKPNQKRLWTRSQAIDDATSLIAEIINMEEE
jgi:hypothetical protein